MIRSRQPLDVRIKSSTPTTDDAKPAHDDLLGGEPLEGSGFENETSDPDFEFDWTAKTQGGHK